VTKTTRSLTESDELLVLEYSTDEEKRGSITRPETHAKSQVHLGGRLGAQTKTIRE